MRAVTGREGYKFYSIWEVETAQTHTERESLPTRGVLSIIDVSLCYYAAWLTGELGQSMRIW